jgi:beta-lactam-binding protein with PASTA domain
MYLRTKFHQKGITFFGLLFVAAVLAMAGVVLAQVFPTVIELQAVQKAVGKAAEQTSVAEIRMAFSKQASIDDIKSITASDIEITKEGDKVVVSFSYQREIHLFGPAFLTLKYSGRSK